MLPYTPYVERTADSQYRNILEQILKEGVVTHNKFQEKGRITCLTTPNMVFHLENGFPIIGERDVSKFWLKPIAEIIAFMKGARTIDELRTYGGKNWANWWKRWTSEEKTAKFGLTTGDLGPGSYGPGFVRTQPDGTVFNQFAHLVKQIQDMPWLTTHRVTPWIPELTLQHNELQRKVVVAPCHGDIQVTIIGGKLVLRMDQRSGDFPVGVPSNMIQWAAFTLMLAQVTGYEPLAYIHSVHDAHMYTDQIKHVRKLLERKPQRLATVRITDSTIKDLFAFTPEHFELTDYSPHPAMDDIPVTE